MSWFWVFPVTCIAATWVYWYYQKCFQYWTSRGVSGPKPILLFGNMLDVMKHPWDMLYHEWTRNYGDTFGIYEGWRPILVITRAEDIKDMTIKNFNKFINRRFLGGDSEGKKILFFRDDDEWKRMRAVMSPAFSSGKMKQMYPLMKECFNLFMGHVDAIVAKEQCVPCKKLYGKLTSTVIARCAFATHVDPYTDENNILYQKLCKFFDFGIVRSFLIALAPQMIVSWLKLTFPDPDSVNYLNEMCKLIVKQRRSNKSDSASFVDLLQSLIDAGKKSEMNRHSLNSTNDHEKHHSVEENLDLSQINLELQSEFTDNEIASNLILFFAAGYETTSNVLNLSTFYLVKYPHIQKKLYSCIKEVYDANGDFDYDSLTSLEYLDAFLCEVMRIQPPVLRVERIASEDHTFTSGVKVEKGTYVQVPIYSVHHNEEYFDEPEVFRPERFLAENRSQIVSGSYLPFLIGPRNCIGMRFALIEAKMSLAYLLLKYQFVGTDATISKLQGEALNPIFIVKHELVVKFVKRN